MFPPKKKMPPKDEMDFGGPDEMDSASGADMGFPPSGPTGTKAKVALPERAKASPLNFKKKRHDKGPGHHLRGAGGNRGMSK